MQSIDLIRDHLTKSRDRVLSCVEDMREHCVVFDGTDASGDISHYPAFDVVLAKCREMRASTVALADSLSENDLDNKSASAPEKFQDTFGTYRLCLQYAADHWYMHRGHLADARRAAGLKRMWL